MTPMMRHLPLRAAALCAALVPAAQAADLPADTQQKLEQQIQQLQQQLDAVKQALQQMQAQAQAAAQRPAAPAPAPVAAAAPAPAPAAAPGLSPDLSLWGYGELYYTHPVHDAKLTQADLARAVFGIGYRLDDRTSFNSEFEVEHAVASADDRGEFEVEQFYVDHQFTDHLGGKGGLFLMPFGLLNEHHEPTAFYGVQRNFVETLIIPSTWREGGLALHGTSDSGLSWDAGLTTGLNLSGWNNSPEDPQYRTALELENNGVAPFQATHQELQLADASHLAQFAALNWRGVPGLLVGGAFFTGDAAMPAVPAGLPQERTTLWEAHARWTPGAADFQAVFAKGTISHTAAYNLANAGVANPLPSSFLGYYAQAAYTLWQDGDAKFSPFVRWEHYDMGASYAGIAPGFSTTPTGLASDGKPWPQPRDRVTTIGANYLVNSHLVLKADYQHFDVNTDLSRFDLGLGVSF
jgi:hypothetical protein